ncbi:MAG: CheR family methyltransferase [Bdellovibrionota bacterium]
MLVSLKKDDIHRLAQIVRDETGNHVQEKNFSMLESRIRSHILKLGLQSIEDYWSYFQANEKIERGVLQSLMTTHYTFFFREYVHFEVLEKWIGEEGPRLKDRFEKKGQPVRIWSAACSRGQEVFSLAMFLEVNLFRKLGIPFEIIGTDIDADSVKHAKNGVYSIQEVNTIPNAYLNGFWKRGTGPVKDFAAVHPSLKAKTRFEVLNLFEIANWSNQNNFDVTFCRNVFIYFSEENVRKVALDIAKKLEPRGLLISGMSEPLRFPGWKLLSVGPSAYLNAVEEANVKVLPLEKLKKIGHAPAPIQETAVTVSHGSEKTSRYRVLCVDDSPTIQLLIKKIFAEDPLCGGVDIAGNGKEAREKLDKGKYDLITLDIHMPEVNGIEFLERLYNKKSDPPVLMVSSVNRTDVELATKSMALGAFDYVEKPAMNNLEKSTGEILTKAKMTMRSKDVPRVESVGGFDTSIGQKIVIPDASQSIRLVVASIESMKLLEQIVCGQKNEYRSPPLLIVWKDSDPTSDLEAQLLGWTERQIVVVREGVAGLRANHIYIAKGEIYQQILSPQKLKSASLQIIDKDIPDLTVMKNIPATQVLVDESLAAHSSRVQKQCGLNISDITPSTSFPSLSVEFFANLRKAAA